MKTKKSIYCSSNFTDVREKGVTLVELMVALSLGLLLTGFLIQSYLSTKQTYRMTAGVGQVQENGRFATHFLSQSVRNAGNLGCIDYVRSKLNNSRTINFMSPITGWDYEGTSSSDTAYTLPAVSFDNTAANYNSTPQDGVSSTNSQNIRNNYLTYINPVKGSDILVINSVETTDVVLNLAATTADVNLTTTEPHGFEQRQILLIGDCFVADLLQNASNVGNQITDAQTTTQQPRNAGSAFRGWSHRWGPDSTVYKVVSVSYYVGIGANGGPSLFRHYMDRGHRTGTPQELVEGVESFQVLYGEDTDSPLDGVPNKYISADLVDDWQNVVSTRISLLLRSQGAFSSDSEAGQTFTLSDGLVVTPTEDDGLIRYVFNTTLKPRNTGAVRNYVAERANATKNFQERARL